MPTTQTIVIDAYDYGAVTPVVQLRDKVTREVITVTSIVVTQSPEFDATYIAVVTNNVVVPADDYLVEFTVSGVLGWQWVTLTGVDAETTFARAERSTVLDSATQAQLDNIETTIEELQTSLNEATVTVTGYASIDTDGVLQLKRAETATLTFTSDSANLVPDLSAGTTKIVMGIKDTAGRVWLSLTGTVLVATGLQSVRFVLTPTLSLALIKGHHNFDVLAIYGYDAGSTPPYASLKTFTSGRVTVTDVYLDPLGL